MTAGGWCMYASANFVRHVLGCINADFCNQILNFLAFFELYRMYTPSHRSKFEIFAKIRQTFSYFSSDFCKNPYFSKIFNEICTDFDEIFSEFREIL